MQEDSQTDGRADREGVQEKQRDGKIGKQTSGRTGRCARESEADRQADKDKKGERER